MTTYARLEIFSRQLFLNSCVFGALICLAVWLILTTNKVKDDEHWWLQRRLWLGGTVYLFVLAGMTFFIMKMNPIPKLDPITASVLNELGEFYTALDNFRNSFALAVYGIVFLFASFLFYISKRVNSQTLAQSAVILIVIFCFSLFVAWGDRTFFSYLTLGVGCLVFIGVPLVAKAFPEVFGEHRRLSTNDKVDEALRRLREQRGKRLDRD